MNMVIATGIITMRLKKEDRDLKGVGSPKKINQC